MTAVESSLTDALRDRYVIERELGGGELYEQRGDRERARHHYARFVELWRECDPELRPAVTEVQQKLAGLDEGALGN